MPCALLSSRYEGENTRYYALQRPEDATISSIGSIEVSFVKMMPSRGLVIGKSCYSSFSRLFLVPG